MKFLFIFIAIFAYKAISNYYNLLVCKKLYDQYKNWLLGKEVNCYESRSKVIYLLKKAGAQDAQVTTTNGFAIQQSNAFACFPSKNKDNIFAICRAFEEAIGVYKNRIFEAINPLYWIDLVVFLPKFLIHYIGMDINNAAPKILNIILTAVWWFLCFIVTVHKEYIIKWIVTFLDKF